MHLKSRKTSPQTKENQFCQPRGNKVPDKQTGTIFMIFIFLFLENCVQCDTMHDFLVWLRTGFNPADNKRIVYDFIFLVG